MIIVSVNPYKSVIVQGEDEDDLITVSEGDNIQFDLESGEVKKGTVMKLQGKGDKLKIQLLPENRECEEIWSVLQMVDGSLKLQDEAKNNDDERMED
jgi:hypothetical protein